MAQQAIDWPEPPDKPLRPQWLSEVIGQKNTVEKLTSLTEAARSERRLLGHILFHGPSGIGKITLSHVIANEMGTSIRIISGENVNSSNLLPILTNIRRTDILLIDDVHHLDTTTVNVLCSAMEDFVLFVPMGGRSRRLQLPKFTLIATTTYASLPNMDLTSRFAASFQLDRYSDQEIAQIINRAVGIMGITIAPDGINEITNLAHGIPRMAIALLRRVAVYAQLWNKWPIKAEFVNEVLKLEERDFGNKGYSFFI